MRHRAELSSAVADSIPAIPAGRTHAGRSRVLLKVAASLVFSGGFMKNSLKIFSAAAAVGLLAACAGPAKRASAQAGAEIVEAEGLAPYSDKDLSAAANAAVLQAQKNAIEAVAVLFMGAQSRAEKYDALQQGLLKNPSLYVKKYKVLSERREGDFYRVNLRAYVYVAKIASVLRGLAISETAQPGVAGALLLDEYFIGGSVGNLHGSSVGNLHAAASPYGDARKAFTGYLGRKTALSFLDTPALKNSGDENSFFEAARASGADLVLIGRAEAAPMVAAQGPQAGFYPARAKAELRIYESGTRKLLLELSSQSNAMDPAEEGAFRKALTSAGELLGAEAFSKADKFIRPATPLTLRVRGLNGIEAVRKLKAAVERLEINGSALESYSEGEAVMSIYPARPDPQEFASTLLRLGVFNLQLDRVSQFEAVFSVIR